MLMPEIQSKQSGAAGFLDQYGGLLGKSGSDLHMAQRLEQAKLKVQEQTPVVSIIQPIQVPLDDTTSGVNIHIAFTGFSFFIAIILLLGRFVLKTFLGFRAN